MNCSNVMIPVFAAIYTPLSCIARNIIISLILSKPLSKGWNDTLKKGRFRRRAAKVDLQVWQQQQLYCRPCHRLENRGDVPSPQWTRYSTLLGNASTRAQERTNLSQVNLPTRALTRANMRFPYKVSLMHTWVVHVSSLSLSHTHLYSTQLCCKCKRER